MGRMQVTACQRDGGGENEGMREMDGLWIG